VGTTSQPLGFPAPPASPRGTRRRDRPCTQAGYPQHPRDSLRFKRLSRPHLLRSTAPAPIILPLRVAVQPTGLESWLRLRSTKTNRSRAPYFTASGLAVRETVLNSRRRRRAWQRN